MLSRLMGQILFTRNSGASLNNEKAEGAAHPQSLNDWLQPQIPYIMSLWLQLKDVGDDTGYSSFLARPPLYEIRIKSLLFPKVDHSFVR